MSRFYARNTVSMIFDENNTEMTILKRLVYYNLSREETSSQNTLYSQTPSVKSFTFSGPIAI